MRHFTASVSDKRGCRLMPAIISITTACMYVYRVSKYACTYMLCTRTRLFFINRVY